MALMASLSLESIYIIYSLKKTCRKKYNNMETKYSLVFLLTVGIFSAHVVVDFIPSDLYDRGLGNLIVSSGIV